jgi:hypothetical protein
MVSRQSINIKQIEVLKFKENLIIVFFVLLKGISSHPG